MDTKRLILNNYLSANGKFKDYLRNLPNPFGKEEHERFKELRTLSTGAEVKWKKAIGAYINPEILV